MHTIGCVSKHLGGASRQIRLLLTLRCNGEGNLLLNDAAAMFKKTNVDTILVTDNGKPIGMLDIQDLESN